MFRIRCLFLLAALVLLPLPLLAAQQGQDSAQSNLDLRPQASSMPSETPLASSLPSGQGAFMPGQTPGQTPGQGPGYAGMPPAPGIGYAPLYVPGNQQSHTGREFVGTPAWAQQGAGFTEPYPPFGANLFQGYFKSTYYDGVNPEYMIMPGDRILIHIWGAHNYSDTLMVDQQGNVFLPEVGPVRVGGLRNAELQSKMRQQLAATFRSNVEMYANLLTSQPAAVYVTGFVSRPGRYAGGVNDSVLYYLDRAGGIIPGRGSYRDILIRRGGKTVTRADLYSFILNGDLPGRGLRDGDVIVVGPKGDSVIADGLIPQHAAYESKNAVFTGKELMHFASPLPAASHVSITGTRNAEPFHIYAALKDFAPFKLSAGDRVEFLADKPGDNILVAISGSTTGQTRYPIKRNTSLRSLLAHVSVDPELSNLAGIYIKRKSVAAQQRKAIMDSLHRMENALLTASSATQEGAAIRVQEAQLLQNFAARVSELEPNGVVVVTRRGVTSDILLEDGDEVVIPQRTDVVQINGEVVMPKAVVHTGKGSAKDYVREAGGFTDRADEDNILVMRPNGEVVAASNTDIAPGDMLLVMPQYDSKKFTIFKDIVQMVYQVAISTGVFLAL